MNKFLINTPGRTASTSLFNHIKNSLQQVSEPTAVDRGFYTDEEIQQFNKSKYAVFTMFNPFKFPFIIDKIDPKEWCLIVLTRKDLASWLLSMISIHATGEWHPGKDRIVTSFTTTQEEFMSSYWYYKCWENRIEKQADEFGFGKVVRIDFDELVQDWYAAGNKIGSWDWPDDSKLMKLGMTTTWSAVENIQEVFSWIPKEDLDLKEQINNQL